MDNLVEEIEIKIEYIESFEIDPLCDKNIISSESDMGIERACDSDESRHFEICQLKKTPNKTICYSNNDKPMHSYNNYKDNATKNKVTWFDAIDNSRRFLCKFCDLKYSTLQTLRFHVKRKHPEQASHLKEILVKCKRNSKLKCHICKQQFNEMLALKSHIDNNHLLEHISRSCLYCDAVFSTKNDIIEHLFIQHKKAFYKCTYICDICGYRTLTKSHYNQHKNTHVEDKTMKCQHCDYATNYLPNLKIHERIHTRDKVYVCEFKNCNYKCSAKSALRSHQLKHNPEDNVLYCDKCNYKTIYKQTLKRHDDCHKRNSIKLKMY